MSDELDRCWYCGVAGRMIIEHMVPRGRGGPDCLRNFCDACQSCNASKGAQTVNEWRIDLHGMSYPFFGERSSFRAAYNRANGHRAWQKRWGWVASDLAAMSKVMRDAYEHSNHDILLAQSGR